MQLLHGVLPRSAACTGRVCAPAPSHGLALPASQLQQPHQRRRRRQRQQQQQDSGAAAASARCGPPQLWRCQATAGQAPVVDSAAPAAAASPSSSAAAADADGLPLRAAAVVARFQAAEDAKGRMALLMEYSRRLPPFPPELKRAEQRVLGCSAQAWVDARLDAATGAVLLRGASDSRLTAGLAGVLVAGLSGLKPDELLGVDAAAFLPKLGLGPAVLAPSRSHGMANMLEAFKRRARLAAAAAAAEAGEGGNEGGNASLLPRFPSLLIGRERVEPQGAFAEAQAQYLQPDAAQVAELARLLREKRIGVVAHFYMDPQVQGVLSAAAESWPHIHISDSLVMADAAVRMAKEGGCEAVCVLGVDFMSENVRAILDEAGLRHVKVYRMAVADIGCSLAEAAESDEYLEYLTEAAATPRSMHVVYINTSLRTKATAHALVPTITCTSSNVVQTVLQGFAQVPDLTVWYGPDTYMGQNLAQLFASLAELPDQAVRELHPAHTAASVRAALPRLKHYASGTCIVHHIFGGQTCELVRLGYNDAYLTAHFEVPGEMFELAMQAKRERGMGVVGSTSNILDFIAGKVAEALGRPYGERLTFVLGTEAGMITSIVRKVQQLLRGAGRDDVEVEVVFPVNPEAITTPEQRVSSSSSSAAAVPSSSSSALAGSSGGGQGAAAAAAATTPAASALPEGLRVLPGPAGGEGCSLEGGCASCPFMKMNTLDALLSVARRVGAGPAAEATLEGYAPRAYADLVGGKTMAAAGCVPILHMRHFGQAKELSEELVRDIVTRNSAAAASSSSSSSGSSSSQPAA